MGFRHAKGIGSTTEKNKQETVVPVKVEDLEEKVLPKKKKEGPVKKKSPAKKRPTKKKTPAKKRTGKKSDI